MSKLIVVNARFLTQSVTGVQRFAIEISKVLKRDLKDKILFVAPNQIIDEALARELDVKIIGNKNGHVWEQYELTRYLKSIGNPNLLNLCNTAPLFYKNNIVTVHDLAFEVFPQTYSKPFLLFYKFLVPRIIKKSKKVLTVSEFSKAEIIKFYRTAADKIDVVYNSASDFFYNDLADVNREKKYFAAVSSLNYRKNLGLVLKAFEIIQIEHPEVHLSIIGGVEKASFARIDIERYKANNNIHFTGRVSDDQLRRYYSNALAFIYPSLYEGFGIPPLEAQKCGTPVVISRQSCLPEVFGESALYCDTSDPKDLAKTLKKLITSEKLRSNMVENGYNNAKRYSWETSAQKLINLISSLP